LNPTLFYFRKVWIDLPPSATAPVYKEKVYVKALRMPKQTELKFKNDDYFFKKKAEIKPKNVDLFASSKDDNINETSKVNPAANGSKAAAQVGNKNNSKQIPLEENKNTNRGNDLHNLISGGSAKAENEKKKFKDDINDDMEFSFPNRNI